MRVFLARHAEAEPGERISDHARVLTGTGARQASALGGWLADRVVGPGLLRCSSATRAVQTAEQILRQVSIPGSLLGEDELYLAPGVDLLAILRMAVRDGTAPLLVGHNPGMAELAIGLSTRGAPEALRRLKSRFPPASCAEIELPDHPEGGVRTRHGELIDFWVPGTS